MTKRYDETIEVSTDPFEGTPLTFRWRGRLYEVDQSLATWREAGAWFEAAPGRSNGAAPQGAAPPGSHGTSAGGENGPVTPPDHICFRVLAHPAGVFATGDIDADGFMSSTGAVYDVYLIPGRGWLLARLWD